MGNTHQKMALLYAIYGVPDGTNVETIFCVHCTLFFLQRNLRNTGTSIEFLLIQYCCRIVYLAIFYLTNVKFRRICTCPKMLIVTRTGAQNSIGKYALS